MWRHQSCISRRKKFSRRSIFPNETGIFRPPLAETAGNKAVTFHKLFNTTEIRFSRFLWTSFSKTRLVLEFFNQNTSVSGRPVRGKAAFQFICEAEKLIWNFSEKLLMLESKWCVKVSVHPEIRKNLKNRVSVHIRIVSLRKIKLNVVKRLRKLTKRSENESKQIFHKQGERRKNILSIETWINKLPISDRAAHWKMIESKMGWREGVRTYIKWIWKRAGGVGEWKNKFDKACLNDERTRKGSHTTGRDKKGNFVLLTDKSHPLRLTPSHPACRVNFKMAWFIDLIIKSHSGTQLRVGAEKAKEKGSPSMLVAGDLVYQN